ATQPLNARGRLDETPPNHRESFLDSLLDNSVSEADNRDDESILSFSESDTDNEASESRQETSPPNSLVSQHSELCGQDGRYCDRCIDGISQQLRYNAQPPKPSVLTHSELCGEDNQYCDTCFDDICQQLEHSQYASEAQLTPIDEQKIGNLVKQLEDLQLQYPGQYPKLCNMLLTDLDVLEARLQELLQENESSSSIGDRLKKIRRDIGCLREVLRRLQDMDAVRELASHESRRV
ncbi:hypothetical protein H4R35_006997, partial [Dimargaris xerosporica]